MKEKVVAPVSFKFQLILISLTSPSFFNHGTAEPGYTLPL